jgi:hypothetical protein
LKYLEIIFPRSGSFCKARAHLCEQAQKAMYGVLNKVRQLNLPIKPQFDLFDRIVVPVLTYGCEIWVYENRDMIERIHLKFLKHIFHLKSSTNCRRVPLHFKMQITACYIKKNYTQSIVQIQT